MSALQWVAIGVVAYSLLSLVVLVAMACLGAAGHAQDELAEEAMEENRAPKGNVRVLPSAGSKPRG